MFFSGIFGISSSSGGLLYFKGFFQDIWGFFWKSLEFFFRVFGNSGSSRSPLIFPQDMWEFWIFWKFFELLVSFSCIVGISGSSGGPLNF